MIRKTLNYTLLLTLFLTTIACRTENKTNADSEYFAKKLKDTNWKIDKLLLEVDTDSVYILSPIDTAQNYYMFGDFAQFADSINFTSYDQDECGNGCYKTIQGQYKFTEEGKIEITRYSIAYSKQCRMTPTNNNKVVQLFSVTEDSTSIIFTREK